MDGVHQPITCPDPARAVLYGQFLEAAYWMYANAPNNPTPSPPSAFPADYEFFAWVQMRDFVIEEGDWAFYGIIAQSRSKPNEYVLAIRGTENLTEWLDDFTSVVTGILATSETRAPSLTRRTASPAFALAVEHSDQIAITPAEENDRHRA